MCQRPPELSHEGNENPPQLLPFINPSRFRIGQLVEASEAVQLSTLYQPDSPARLLIERKGPFSVIIIIGFNEDQRFFLEGGNIPRDYGFPAWMLKAYKEKVSAPVN